MVSVTCFLREKMPFCNRILQFQLSLVLTDDLIRCDNFLVPPKLYITDTKNSYCQGLSRCGQEKDIIVVTVLPEKSD